jgi:hypothetical protein
MYLANRSKDIQEKEGSQLESVQIESEHGIYVCHVSITKNYFMHVFKSMHFVPFFSSGIHKNITFDIEGD